MIWVHNKYMRNVQVCEHSKFIYKEKYIKLKQKSTFNHSMDLYDAHFGIVNRGLNKISLSIGNKNK